MPIETTYTAARDQLKSLMDRVVKDREVVMVRRRHGGDLALVAADELEGLLWRRPISSAHPATRPACSRPSNVLAGNPCQPFPLRTLTTGWRHACSA